jgi:hypothetical protein
MSNADRARLWRLLNGLIKSPKSGSVIQRFAKRISAQEPERAHALIHGGLERALGRQLRVDAAIDATHELVRSGPYQFVRHPIYTSMLCVIVRTGLMLAPAYLFLPGLALFLVGTEIRMRTEDRLLESRFGEGASSRLPTAGLVHVIHLTSS